MNKLFCIATLMLLCVGVLTLTCEIKADPLENRVTLYMTPLMYVAKEVGESFNLTVNISCVENLKRVELTITYTTSLLDVIQVVQGSFFPPPPKSHFEWENNENLGIIEVNMSLADSETPKNGNGTLALISFRVVQGPESCAGSPVQLKNALLLNSESAPITYDSTSAVYFWKSIYPDPPMTGPVLDIYTNKGGRGMGNPGGWFVAGELIYLISLVTYNGDPMQQKLVAFEVKNPMGESILFRTATTNREGLAEISFRVFDQLSNNGTWTAISTVDIAGTVVWDVISFQIYSKAPVGGYSISTPRQATSKLLTPYVTLTAILTFVFTAIKRKTRNVRNYL